MSSRLSRGNEAAGLLAIPLGLRSAFRRNQKMMYGLLMQVSSPAFKDLCADKRDLGAHAGILSVLHTTGC